MALPTKGRVIIETTVGELDIELWSKETPKTCRNFIALALEGYYDGCIFHRVVPGFLVQTGDKTGTGAGGESFYGEPFEDEIHPRLRYSHRGLVGMANNGTKDSNDSQFFVTLDRADELHGKHTLFGRCVGDTIFNVMKIGDMELDDNGKPLYPPKIKTVRIVDNPFPDIVPRITAAEKREQQRAREKAQREREEEIRRRGAKKNTKLLSFQDDAIDDEQEIPKKKSIVRPDLVDNTDGLSVALKPEMISAPIKSPVSQGFSKPLETPKVEKAKKVDNDEIVGLRDKYSKEKSAAENERQAQIEKLEKEIKKLNDKRVGYDSDEERQRKKVKTTSLWESELAKYEKLRGAKGKKGESGRKGKNEGDTLALMNAFRGRLKGLSMGDDKDDGDQISEGGAGVENEMEVDDDRGFLSHALSFPKDNDEEVAKAERDYEVIDPRQRGARAREEERERKKRIRPKDGGRGYRR